VVANIALSLALMGPLKHGGLALATSVAGCLNFVVLFGILSRRVGGLDSRRILRSLLKVAAASAIMGLAAWWTISRFDYSHPTLSYRVLALTASLAVGIIVYSILVFLFRVEEAKAIIRMVMERWTSKRN
jgi:putative peptidoglycan lipid II flippase